MDAFWVMFRTIAIFLLLAVPGFLLVKLKIMKDMDAAGLSKVLVYFGLPFQTFTGTVDKLVLDGKMLLLIAVTFVTGLVFTFLFCLATKPLTASEKNAETRGVLRFSAAFPNNGFLGIPLAMAVFGDGKVLALVIVLNIANNLMMYTVGRVIIGGGKEKMDFKKAFLNPVLIAFILGLLANALGLRNLVPEVSTYSSYFAAVVAPLSMTVAGIQLASVSAKTLFSSGKVYYVSLLKLLLFPAVMTGVMLLMRFLIPGSFIDSEVVMAFFIAFAMPTAGLATTFAIQFRSDKETATACMLGTTILAVISVPVLYWAVTAIL